MDRLKSMRRFTVALVLVVILGLGAGVGLGYMNTERLISDGLILGSIGALRYSVEVLSQARDQAISRESQAEVEASQALVFLAASQDAADQGQDPTPYLQRAPDSSAGSHRFGHRQRLLVQPIGGRRIRSWQCGARNGGL